MIDQGIDTYVEVGPGRTLNGFLRKISRDVRGYNIEDMDSLKKHCRDWGFKHGFIRKGSPGYGSFQGHW
jgi:hypothetical protein